MSTASNQQEPSMEEILSSIRRIISDEQEEGAKTEAANPPAGDKTVDEGPAAAALADEPELADIEPTAADHDLDDDLAAAADDDEDDVLDLTDVVAEPHAKATEEIDEDDGLEAALASSDADLDDSAAAEVGDIENEGLDLDDVELAPIEDDEPEPDEDADVSLEPMIADAEPEAEPAPMHANLVDDKPTLAKKVEDSLLNDATAVASAGAMAKLAKAAAGDSNRAIADGDKTIEQFMVDLVQPMLKDWLDANLNTIVERVVEQEVKKLARRAELM